MCCTRGGDALFASALAFVDSHGFFGVHPDQDVSGGELRLRSREFLGVPEQYPFDEVSSLVFNRFKKGVETR